MTIHMEQLLCLNWAAFGIETGTPIIIFHNRPLSLQVLFKGFLSLTNMTKLQSPLMMKLSIAYNHRFIDGVSAAGFTNSIKKCT